MSRKKGVIPEPPRPKTRVEPIAERRAFEIKWPNVIRIEHVYRAGLSLDWNRVGPLTLEASDTRLLAELGPIGQWRWAVSKTPADVKDLLASPIDGAQWLER